MRTLIHIDEAQIRKLDHLAAHQRRSRAAIIREAVASYLATQGSGGMDEAFGLWRYRAIDGLEYQNRLREEW